MLKKVFFLIIFSILGFSLQKTKEEWKSRSMTARFARSSDSEISECELSNYCGGTYQGMLNHLDFIADMGFNAIWISPIIENTEGSYHGYAFTNLYKEKQSFW